MASLQRRDGKNGPRWRVLYRVDGKLLADTFGHPDGATEYKALVERIGGQAAREVLHQRRGSAGAGRIPTVEQALDQHIDALHAVTDGTRSDYRKIAKLISDGPLGPLPVDAVTTDAVNRWVAGQKASAKTKRNRHGLLFAALKRQVKAGNIAANPCDDVQIARTERAEMTIVNDSELALILGHMDAHWHALILTLFSTGLRFGEATAVQVRDLDLDAEPPMLRVSRSWKHTDTSARELGAPKTAKGRRPVSLPPALAVLLHDLTDGWPREAFVFVNKHGRPVRQNSLHEIWSAALDDADIGKRPRIHDLRHSHVAAMIAAGVPLPVIMRRLGHESITTTVDTYGHLSDDAMSITAQAAAISIAAVLPEIEPPPSG
jgi:integrase